MPAVSSIFLILSLVLAVVIGPQTRAWSWGPALLALGIAVSAALPLLWRKSRDFADFGFVAMGMLVAAWFAWRACLSPVKEFGEADLLLLSGTVGPFLCIRVIQGNLVAERILSWGIALLLLANILVIWRQVIDPAFTPIFSARAASFPSGFYAHYNEAANYLIASSMLVAAACLFGKHSSPTRIFFGLLAIGGLAAVYFTRSRGGILGTAGGVGVLAAASLMIGWNKKARWFTPAMIAVPVISLAIGGYLYLGWKDSQALRLINAGGVKGSGIAQMMDNDSRLYLLGIALSCVGLHPLAGGGSRSFSWESFRFAERTLQGGNITHIPEQVHNELLQSATDYGLIGAGLLIGLLVAMVIIAVVRILFSLSQEHSGFAAAWRVGGLAALAGMMIQSCFSFVFHLVPGCILLGICLGQLSRNPTSKGKPAQVIGAKILLSCAAIFCMLFLLPAGWKGSRVTVILWPTFFSKNPLTSTESKVDALNESLRIWPQASLYQERAFAFQAASSASDGIESKELAEHAVSDYEEAAHRHPFDPDLEINRANVLSQLQRDREAEDAYDRAINLQGGMEPAFRARFLLSMHLLKKGNLQFNTEYPMESLATLEIAAQQMEESVKEMHWMIRDMIEPRVAVQESLGAAREASGDYEGAMNAYDFAANLLQGNRAHYRAGVLNGKLAANAWAGRHSSEALWYFIEAKRRILLAKDLPAGVTESKKLVYLTYLDEAINYLKIAKIAPKAPHS